MFTPDDYYALGARQSLFPSTAGFNPKPVSHMQLSASYRCPKAVIALQHTLTGGLSDRHEISHFPLSTDTEKELGEVFV